MFDWALPDLTIGLDCAAPKVARAGTDIDLEYSVQASGDGFVLSFGDAATFRVCFQSRAVDLVSVSSDDSATAAHFLFDHVIPRIMSAEAPLVLHGSLVRIGNSLAIFTGPTGAGKSTLGASLDAQGHHLLGDDAVIITEQGGVFCGEAVYPSLRLFPDSIASVLGNDVGTAPMAHYSTKRHVTNFRNSATAPVSLPIGCVFALHGGGAVPQVRALSARESCMAMIDQSFAFDPQDIGAASKRMSAAARLASTIPGFALNIPHDYALLPQVHTLIERCMTLTEARDHSVAAAPEQH